MWFNSLLQKVPGMASLLRKQHSESAFFNDWFDTIQFVCMVAFMGLLELIRRCYPTQNTEVFEDSGLETQHELEDARNTIAELKAQESSRIEEITSLQEQLQFTKDESTNWRDSYHTEWTTSNKQRLEIEELKRFEHQHNKQARSSVKTIDLQIKIDDLKIKLHNAETQRDEARKQHESVTTSAAKLESELTQLRQKVQSQNNKAETEKLRAELSRSERTITNLKADVQNNKAETEKLGAKLSRSERTITNLKADVQTKTAQLEHVEKDARVKTRQLQKKISKLETEAAIGERKSGGHKKALSDLQGAIAHVKVELVAQGLKALNLGHREGDMEEKIYNLQTEVADLKKEGATKAFKIASLERELTEKLQELSTSNESAAAKSREITRLESEGAVRDEKMRAMEERILHLEAIEREHLECQGRLDAEIARNDALKPQEEGEGMELDSSLQSTVDNQAIAIEEYKKHLELQRQEIQKLQEQNQALLSASRNDSVEMEVDSEKGVDSIEGLKQAFNAQIDGLRSQLRDKESQLHAKDRDIQQARLIIGQMEGSERAKRDLAERERKVLEREQRFKKREEDLERRAAGLPPVQLDENGLLREGGLDKERQHLQTKLSASENRNKLMTSRLHKEIEARKQGEAAQEANIAKAKSALEEHARQLKTQLDMMGIKLKQSTGTRTELEAELAKVKAELAAVAEELSTLKKKAENRRPAAEDTESVEKKEEVKKQVLGPTNVKRGPSDDDEEEDGDLNKRVKRDYTEA